MATKIGLYTSFVIGLFDDKDVWHKPATELYQALRANNFRLFIFDCVIAEVISTLARRTQEKRRASDFQVILNQIKQQFPAKTITWLYPELPSQYDSIAGLVESSLGELNFNDALIAIACQDRKIQWLASFDSDFDSVGWIKRAAQASDLSEI